MVSSFPDARFSKEEEILNDPNFLQMCETLCLHKNNSFTAEKIYMIWEHHCLGYSNRAIARDLGSTEASVRRAIIKISIWVDLL